jgi:perosamine synthetase
MPAHLHPVYQDFKAELPRTDRIWRRLLTLPLYPDLADAEQSSIIQAIESFIP